MKKVLFLVAVGILSNFELAHAQYIEVPPVYEVLKPVAAACVATPAGTIAVGGCLAIVSAYCISDAICDWLTKPTGTEVYPPLDPRPRPRPRPHPIDRPIPVEGPVQPQSNEGCRFQFEMCIDTPDREFAAEQARCLEVYPDITSNEYGACVHAAGFAWYLENQYCMDVELKCLEGIPQPLQPLDPAK